MAHGPFVRVVREGVPMAIGVEELTDKERAEAFKVSDNNTCIAWLNSLSKDLKKARTALWKIADIVKEEVG